MVNRVVTRGFGPSQGIPGRSGPIVMGFGPPLFVIVSIQQEVVRRRSGGGGGLKRHLRELQPVIVWAKLIEINRIAPKQNIEGHIAVQKSDKHISTMIEHVSTRVRNMLEDIKVIVKMIK